MGKRAPVGRRLRRMRRSGIWREFTERKWGWQAADAHAAAERQPCRFELVQFTAGAAHPKVAGLPRCERGGTDPSSSNSSSTRESLHQRVQSAYSGTAESGRIRMPIKTGETGTPDRR
ncbi:hypothetical protein CFB45_16900 [Burkholderia sp. HI2500]|nr:hypothetical protein CFB45_16900 [Burkholderia sp. HI2500]